MPWPELRLAGDSENPTVRENREKLTRPGVFTRGRARTRTQFLSKLRKVVSDLFELRFGDTNGEAQVDYLIVFGPDDG